MYDDIVVPRRLSDIVKGDTALHLDKAAKLVLSSPEVAYRIVHTLIPEANDLPFENFDKTYQIQGMKSRIAVHTIVQD